MKSEYIGRMHGIKPQNNRTHAKNQHRESQFFHADDSDLVGLLCIVRALEGGESDIVSSHHVYNVLRAKRPDVLRTLVEPIWYFDRKGEVSQGQNPYIRKSVLYLEPREKGRVYCMYDCSAMMKALESLLM